MFLVMRRSPKNRNPLTNKILGVIANRGQKIDHTSKNASSYFYPVVQAQREDLSRVLESRDLIFKISCFKWNSVIKNIRKYHRSLLERIQIRKDLRKIVDQTVKGTNEQKV